MYPLNTSSNNIQYSLHGENKTALYTQWFVFITFIVLYYKTIEFGVFLVFNRHIARQVFILDGIWSIFSSGWNPGLIYKFTSQSFSSHKHGKGEWQRVCQHDKQKDKFADITNQQLNKIMDDKYGLNTKRSTKEVVRLFRKYLLEKEVDTDFEHYYKQILDQTLCKFYPE